MQTDEQLAHNLGLMRDAFKKGGRGNSAALLHNAIKRIAQLSMEVHALKHPDAAPVPDEVP